MRGTQVGMLETVFPGMLPFVVLVATLMPLFSAHNRLQVPRAVVTRAVDGATVLLNTDTGRYFKLDDVGTRAWTVLTSSPSIQHGYDTLLSEYQVEPEELRRDLEALVESLEGKGLAEVRRG